MKHLIAFSLCSVFLVGVAPAVTIPVNCNIFTGDPTGSLYAVALTASGDLEITDTSKGLILKSPGGTRYRLKSPTTAA